MSKLQVQLLLDLVLAANLNQPIFKCTKFWDLATDVRPTARNNLLRSVPSALSTFDLDWSCPKAVANGAPVATSKDFAKQLVWGTWRRNINFK